VKQLESAAYATGHQQQARVITTPTVPALGRPSRAQIRIPLRARRQSRCSSVAPTTKAQQDRQASKIDNAP
jgi:hypothetical protein